MKTVLLILLIYIEIQYILAIVNYLCNIKCGCTDFIENQRHEPACNHRFALKHSWYNGCGWISCYNIMKIHGKNPDPARIICALEVLLAPFCLGFFGANPLSVFFYLVLCGYKVKLRFSTEKSTADTGIMLYMTKNLHAHYVAFEKQENGVVIHNPNVKAKSFTEYLASKSGKLIVLIDVFS